MYERHGLIVAETLPPTTEHVIHGYNNAGVLQAFESFDVSGDMPGMRDASEFRDSQKSAFLQGTVRNPVLNNCPNFELQRSNRREMRRVATSLKFVQEQRRDEGVVASAEDGLLDSMIASRVRELDFVETAATIAANILSPERRAGQAEALKSTAREIYGMPDINRALTLIDRRLQKARNIVADESHPMHDIAEQLIASITLPEFATSEATMSEEMVSHYRTLIRTMCQKAIEYSLEEVNGKDILETTESADVFNRYLQIQGYAEDGWKAILVPNRSSCAAKMTDTVIEIGEKRTAGMRKQNKVIESEIHEAEVHAGRQAKGKKLGAGLAEFGLLHYGSFEEPFAATVASMYHGKPKSAGEPFTIAIALAAGYDAHPERDFRDCYEILWRLSAVNQYTQDKSYDMQVESAQTSAYSNLVRIWRGMPTDVPGCVFPKDRVYDNTEVIEYLQNNGQPLPEKHFLRLFAAKYNPLQPGQDQYIQKLMDSKTT
ncbi:MAG TPA: hypothetical protein VF575_04250 [Candidatus Saccharimonadales bacterium]|jgi:hypothetical protein